MPGKSSRKIKAILIKCTYAEPKPRGDQFSQDKRLVIFLTYRHFLKNLTSFSFVRCAHDELETRELTKVTFSLKLLQI